MDIQFWIWLIIVVATLLSRAMKKSAQKPQPPPRTDSGHDHSPDNKPMTFEDLLREIQASKTPPQPVATRELRKPVKSYDVDYDDDIEEEEKSYETIPRNDNQSYEVYEKAKQEAFYRPSLEETMKLEDTVMKYSHFKGYEETSQRSLTNEILQDFRDPEGFKKAFIMSEILKRKF